MTATYILPLSSQRLETSVNSLLNIRVHPDQRNFWAFPTLRERVVELGSQSCDGRSDAV